MELQPNCSEIVCKLGEHFISDNLFEIFTDTYPNDAVKMFVRWLKENAECYDELPGLEFLDNVGGGGNWDYVVDYKIAKAVYNKKITLKKGLELERKAWEGDEIDI